MCVDIEKDFGYLFGARNARVSVMVVRFGRPLANPFLIISFNH